MIQIPYGPHSPQDQNVYVDLLWLEVRTSSVPEMGSLNLLAPINLVENTTHAVSLTPTLKLCSLEGNVWNEARME